MGQILRRRLQSVKLNVLIFKVEVTFIINSVTSCQPAGPGPEGPAASPLTAVD